MNRVQTRVDWGAPGNPELGTGCSRSHDDQLICFTWGSLLGGRKVFMGRAISPDHPRSDGSNMENTPWTFSFYGDRRELGQKNNSQEK